eukprot:gene8563-1183_t
MPAPDELNGRWVASGGEQGARRVDVSGATLSFSWISATGGGDSQLCYALDGVLVRDGQRLSSTAYEVGAGLSAMEWADGERWARSAAAAPRARRRSPRGAARSSSRSSGSRAASP